VIPAIRDKLSAAENKVATTEKKLATIEKKLATTKEVPATTEEFVPTRRKLAISKLKLSTPKHQYVTSDHNAITTEHAQATVEHECANTEHDHATAEYMNATSEHKFATALHDFATDCLRLLMHFFYPIQQCAQQVYHTAVPLLPTSSPLHQSCLQSVINNKLSYVAAFSGAPSTWGSLLRTIDFRPRQLTYITTSVHGIISACENIVEVYSVVTGVLLQSLCAPEPVTKIQHSLDGSILFFVHSSSVTMWDVQTGGHIHTFSVQSKISDVAISVASIACGSSDGSVTFWGIFTKVKEKHFWRGDPVVTIGWLSPQRLIVVTQKTLSVHNVITGRNSDTFPIPGCAWGMVYLNYRREFLVGTSQSSPGVGQEESLFITTKYVHALTLMRPGSSDFDGKFIHVQQSPAYSGQLSSPIFIQDKIVCSTPANGVKLFGPALNIWTNSPSSLSAAVSVAVLSNRNLVVQTKDSIQIFAATALESGWADNVHLSHLYPLGENHIICVLQSTRNLALLKLETLRELHPDDNTLPLKSLLQGQSTSPHTLFGRGLAAEFGISEVVKMWQSGTPLPERTEATEEDAPLRGWSPERTRVVKVYGSPRWELCIEDPKEGITLASLPLGDSNLGVGDVYDIIFDSETRFHLKIDGPGWHVKIPHIITASRSGCYSHTITKGGPVPLLKPRETPPYTLDANCEWVLDAKSRKVCWISPGDIRRGNGGHFWAGSSLVMVGGDGVVRKVTFKDPGL